MFTGGSIGEEASLHLWNSPVGRYHSRAKLASVSCVYRGCICDQHSAQAFRPLTAPVDGLLPSRTAPLGTKLSLG